MEGSSNALRAVASGARSHVVRRLAAVGLAIVLASLANAALARADSCTNDAFRVGASANLPDCRAYEMVSPPDKNGYDITPGNDAVTVDGGTITYQSYGAFAGNPAGPKLDQYLSTRTSSGWTTMGINIPTNPFNIGGGQDDYEGFSPDLSQGVVNNGDPPVGGATPGTLNLYLWSESNPVALLTPGETEANTVPDYEGASADFSQIYLTDPQALLSGPDSVAYGLYDWDAGALSLVSVLPNGHVSQGDLGSQTDGVNDITGTAANAVSSDGSVFWSDESAGGGALVPIYQYENGASTEITTSQCTLTTGCTKGGGDGVYWTASTDGTYAFFTSPERLTNNSTAKNSATYGDLYMYDTATKALTDLTVDPTSTDPLGSDVQGVIGASGDGSSVYFVANGVLAPGATHGKCGGASSTATCNLYVWHSNGAGGGAITFIATLSNSDSGDWGLVWPAVRSDYSQVSPDGTNLIYTSVQAPASGYQNAGHTEIYMYNATANAITCVSCRGLGTGSPAQGDADLAAHTPCGIPFPGDCFIATAPFAGPNNITSDGTQVFFDSSDQLTPGITNSTDNVFEWEADGTGSCATTGGCVYLLSSGGSPDPSEFLNASPSGDDVFILTREQLLSQDTDDNVDVYDARVDGGFPSPSGGSTPPCTDATSCRGSGTPSAPTAPVAATITFVGPGNGAVSAATAARVRILHKRVRGTAIALRVQVPEQGWLVTTGDLVPTFSKHFGRSGTDRLYLTLTNAAKRKLARKHKLKMTLHISYTTADGTSKATVRVTVVS